MKTFLMAALLALAQDEAPLFYRAEGVLYQPNPANDWKGLVTAGELRVLFGGEIGEFIDKVYADPWLKKRFPSARKPRWAMGSRRDAGYADIRANAVFFPPHKETGKAVSSNCHVLHEINHLLLPNNGHDRAFAMNLAVLIDHFVGQESAKVLMRSYVENGRPGWVPRILMESAKP